MIAVIAHSVTRPAPRPAIAWAAAPRRVVWPAEEEIPAPGVLLAAQEPGARQQPPHGAEDHERHGDLEDGEAAHRLELWGGPEEGAHRLVRAVGGGQGASRWAGVL